MHPEHLKGFRLTPYINLIHKFHPGICSRLRLCLHDAFSVIKRRFSASYPAPVSNWHFLNYHTSHVCKGSKSDPTGLYWCVCGLTFTNMPINNTIPTGDSKHPGCKMSSELMPGQEFFFKQTLFLQTKDPASLRARKKSNLFLCISHALISILLSPCSPSTHH